MSLKCVIDKIVTARVTFACALTVAAGCAQKHVETWTPKPKVQWTDISTEPVPALTNEYRIVVPQPTRGLFPASIGVTRVAVKSEDEETTGRKLHLVRDPRNEFLQWNSAFDDQMAVSEVFPIAQRDLGGAEAAAEQIIAANRALHARISLIYAMNELSETQTEMIGTLYDTETAQRIAAFHAEAFSILPLEEEQNRDPIDLWKTDSKALVRTKFERHVYACIRELILGDEPAPVEAPTGWIPVGPIKPVEWPPKQFRPRP